MTVQRRKLIEVALPLEVINRESVREKSIRHGHPSTLHLWWARRPLAAARAVLFAQLVDDPSSLPEEFPTHEAQDAERMRLFEIIERLVVWENASDEHLLAEAHAEILKSTGGNPPAVLDPFAGGGSIPLEAQRLGLEAHASDLNPVAVLINKALVEIPPKFARQPPVFPGAADGTTQHWPRATGLAEDVRRYGQWMLEQAEGRLGHLYPRAKLPDGSTTNVIAWIWVRAVTCPNPACGAQIPLASTWWLSKKKDRPAWIRPVVTGGEVEFEIRFESSGPPAPPKVGRGARFTCLVCADTTTDAYVKHEATAKRMEHRLMAVVAEGKRRRVYLPATKEHIESARVARPAGAPDAPMPTNPRWFSPPSFGLTNFADIFTNRQLVLHDTMCGLVAEVRVAAAVAARRAGMGSDHSDEYGNAVSLYLSLACSRMTDMHNSLITWSNGRDQAVHLFGRKAIPMLWDFAEVNPLVEAAGGIGLTTRNQAQVIDRLPAKIVGIVSQADAASLEPGKGVLVATDPPYYDNIGYADLSDFFYVWLRRALGTSFPDLTGTILTPKTQELIASPHRHGSKRAADLHFERGLRVAFERMRRAQVDDFPLTLFYAFKQAESKLDGVVSTGWETMLSGLLDSGLAVTATWPMRTERDQGLKTGTNVLASSILLACRPREKTAGATNRRGFLSALKLELPKALRHLQQGSVAPVDLAQAAIGPGMAVFTRYSRVIEADGAEMTVRTALALINQVLDETLSEQEGDFDSDTRFCVKWFGQYAWDETDSGTADVLARATNTSIEGLQRGGVFRAVAGKARLLSPDDLSDSWDPLTDVRTSVWEVTLHLAKAVSERGADAGAALMNASGQRVDLDAVKELAYLLYNISERKGWTSAALLFNGLGTSWIDLNAAVRASTGKPKSVADTLNFDGTES